MSDAKIPCPLRHFFPALEHRESMCGVFDKKKPASPEKKLWVREEFIFFREMGWFYGKTGVFALKKINAQDVKRNIVFEGTAFYV